MLRKLVDDPFDALEHHSIRADISYVARTVLFYRERRVRHSEARSRGVFDPKTEDGTLG